MNHRMKILLPYIIFIGFIVYMFGNSTIVAKNRSDIVTMTELIQHDKNVLIENWSVYAREKNTDIKTENDFNWAVKRAKEKFPHFQWEIKKHNNEWKAFADYTNSETGLAESIHLMAAREGKKPVSYTVYEVKGRFWEERYTAFFENTFQNRIKDIFRGNPTIFSCIQGVINDNIDTVLSTQTGKLLDLFQAREIERMEEKNFLSVSAHTSLFDQTLTNEQLNLQIALRTEEGLGGKTAFAVGTPIVTFEY